MGVWLDVLRGCRIFDVSNTLIFGHTSNPNMTEVIELYPVDKIEEVDWMNEREELIRLAAIIDCEGSIGIHRSRHGHACFYFPAIQICNTNFDLIKEVLRILAKYGIDLYHSDHNVKTSRYLKNGWKPAHNIRITGLRRTTRLLMLVTPYLVAKRAQAELVTQFTTRRIKKDNDHGWVRQPYDPFEMSIITRLSKINKRGLR